MSDPEDDTVFVPEMELMLNRLKAREAVRKIVGNYDQETEMPEQEKMCINCKWIDARHNEHRCTRRAPVLVPQLVHPEGFNLMEATRFPVIFAWQTCGEWESK